MGDTPNRHSHGDEAVGVPISKPGGRRVTCALPTVAPLLHCLVSVYRSSDAWPAVAISTSDQQELYQLAEAKMMAAAEESELRKQAEENTRGMLVGMLRAIDITATVTFDAPAG